jgi:hypothetical protein
MLKRLPSFSEIVPVYAVIASMLFAWSILQFFWYLPSWLHFMAFENLFGVFCYVMASSFIESLFFLLFLLLLSFILPQRYFKGEFAAYGTALALAIIGPLVIRMILLDSFGISIPQFGLVLVSMPIVFSFLSLRVSPVRKAVTLVADRLIVFLYILIPLSLLSLFVIAARNFVRGW